MGLMNVIVCGTRDTQNADEWVRRAMDLAQREYHITPACIYHGCSGEVDWAAEHWAKKNGIPYKRFWADWNTHGKAAGPMRNQRMADAGADAVVAIWDGKSSGTADMKRRMRGKAICVVRTGVHLSLRDEQIDLFYPAPTALRCDRLFGGDK